RRHAGQPRLRLAVQLPALLRGDAVLQRGHVSDHLGRQGPGVRPGRVVDADRRPRRHRPERGRRHEQLLRQSPRRGALRRSRNMVRTTRATRAPGRPSFTLVEMVVVVGIILVLASLSLVGVMKTLNYQQRRNTETGISKVDPALQKLWLRVVETAKN